MEEQKDTFVREKIKNKPIDRHRVLQKAGLSALCGCVFALAAVGVLLLCSPLLHHTVATEGSTEHPAEPGETVSEETTSAVESQQVEASETESSEEPQEDIRGYTLEDYQAFQDEVYEIGKRVSCSIVTVTSIVSGMDWFDNPYETKGQQSGVIFRHADQKYYILTRRGSIQEAESVLITFSNGEMTESEVVSMDVGTGLVVLSVSEELMDNMTQRSIKIAGFGDAGAVKRGEMVLALGSLPATVDSIFCGSVTSTAGEISRIDANYHLITTDIVVGEAGNGILINMSGDIVGIALQGADASEQKGTFAAVSATDLQPVIRRLERGGRIPYIGLWVSTVTEAVVREYHLPRGVYVKLVETDSPAMEGGLQNGDVVTAIDGSPVTTVDEYSRLIRAMKKKDTCEVTVMRPQGETYREITFEVTASIIK